MVKVVQSLVPFLSGFGTEVLARIAVWTWMRCGCHLAGMLIKFPTILTENYA